MALLFHRLQQTRVASKTESVCRCGLLPPPPPSFLFPLMLDLFLLQKDLVKKWQKRKERFLSRVRHRRPRFHLRQSASRPRLPHAGNDTQRSQSRHPRSRKRHRGPHPRRDIRRIDRHAWRRCAATSGKLDILVNNAGAAIFGPLVHTSIEEGKTAYDANV